MEASPLSEVSVNGRNATPTANWTERNRGDFAAGGGGITALSRNVRCSYPILCLQPIGRNRREHITVQQSGKRKIINKC
jgi:hypothetical protein